MSVANEVAIELAISEIVDKITTMPKVIEVIVLQVNYCDPNAAVVTLHSSHLGMSAREEVRAPCPVGVSSEDFARLLILRVTNMMKCGGRFTVGSSNGDRDEGYWQVLLTLKAPVLL